MAGRMGRQNPKKKKIAFYFLFYFFFPYIVVLAQVGQRVEKDGENLKQKVVKCLKKTKKINE